MRLEAALTVPVPAPATEPARPAPGMFLVASRSFRDTDFQGSVVYLLQHDERASLGIIVNRPTPALLSEWRPELEHTRLAALPLYDGGPVNPEILLTLFENPAWEDRYDTSLARHVQDGVFASMRARILDRLLHDEAKAFKRVRCYFGHIGWVPGQLERELERHDWHLIPGAIDAVFGPDAGRLWQRLIEPLEPAQPQPLPVPKATPVLGRRQASAPVDWMSARPVIRRVFPVRARE